MRLVYPSGSLQDIIERSTTTLLTVNQGVAAAAGAAASSAGVSPAAGKRWLILHVSCGIIKTAAGVATDRGLVAATLNGAPSLYNFHAVELDPGWVANIERVSAQQAYVVMDSTDVFRCFTEARSSSVQLSGSASLIGFEYNGA